MKKKVAKLVLWSPMTRVVVDEDATYDEIVWAARGNFKDKLIYEYESNIEEVLDDEECPYDPEEEGDVQWVITAEAPTVYQYNSLQAFGMVIKERGNGSFTAEDVFDTEDEAKDYLCRRVQRYAQTEEKFREYEKEIEQGYLTLDAVTAYINLKNRG